MITPQKYTARLEEKYELNDNYVEFHFELETPGLMANLAGQYVMLTVPNPEDENKPLRRAYSMTQRPDVEHGFEIVVAQQNGGVGVNYLNKLQFGEKVEILAPLGQLVIDDAKTEETELVFVATGAGIAPFKAMIMDQLQNKHDQRKITLYWGIRQPNDFFWLEDWVDLQKNWANFRLVLVSSQPTPDWTLSRGHVDDCLIADGVARSAGCYLCGSPGMIGTVVKVLKERFEVANIHIEQF